ncbi:CPBP family intramembrane glutamic endopeptidase [Lacticaseibacillus zeae]|uniref:CPBP family intramembrane glutamic endopeptidase n=1 Tax=Lacticaseibacillus zeae TaxID=57037 RepID=UPI001CDA7A3B|nr:type II CAAX endopeptidase family protein [Lacticaseibacillus zeae]
MLIYILTQVPSSFLVVIPNVQSVSSTMMLAAAFFLASAIVIYIAYRFVFKYTQRSMTQRVELRDIWYIVGGYVITVISDNVLMALNNLIYHQSDTPNNQMIRDSFMDANWMVTVLLIVEIVLITPITEELIFRGVLFNLFFSPNRIGLRTLLSTSLFAAVHATDTIFGFLLYAFSGIVFATVYAKTGKLQNAMALHVVMNAAATVAILLS